MKLEKIAVVEVMCEGAGMCAVWLRFERMRVCRGYMSMGDGCVRCEEL